MNTKLSISIDKKVREAGKVYARQNNTSVSRLVEDYLMRLMTRTQKDYSQSVAELMGFAGQEPTGTSAKEEKLAYLSKKYLQE